MPTALITGGSRGIGRVTAMRLLAEGWAVAITYSQSIDAALQFEREATASLGSEHARIAAYECDVRDGASNRTLVEMITGRFGAIDALVNNAGIRDDALLFNMTDQQFDDVIETNLKGIWLMTKSVLPLMMALMDEVSVSEGSERHPGTTIRLVKCRGR